MSLREEFEKETGKKLHFTPRKTNIKDYVEWLEQKLSLPKESDAVKFGEWLLKDAGMRWRPGDAQWIIGMRPLTTAEAYKLFKAEEKEK
jgi:hypothetical protein